MIRRGGRYARRANNCDGINYTQPTPVDFNAPDPKPRRSGRPRWADDHDRRWPGHRLDHDTDND